MGLERVAVNRRLPPRVAQGDEHGQVPLRMSDALVEELPGAGLFEMLEDVTEHDQVIGAEVVDHIERIPDMDGVVDGPLVILDVVRIRLDAVDPHLPAGAVVGFIQHHVQAVPGQKPPFAVAQADVQYRTGPELHQKCDKRFHVAVGAGGHDVTISCGD